MSSGGDGPAETEDHESADDSSDDAELSLDLDTPAGEASDPEAVFEVESDDPDAVVAAVEAETEVETGDDDSAVGVGATDDEVDDAVSGLFDDLGDVDATPDPDSDPAPEDPTADDWDRLADPDPEETAAEVETLFGDLETVDVDSDTTEIDVDLDAGVDAGVEADADADLGMGTAHTQPTVLDPAETDTGGFQWLGEDVQVFDGDGDPDGVFETFDEETPESLFEDSPAGDDGAAAADTGLDADAVDVPGLSATTLFSGLSEGTVEYPDDPPAGDATAVAVGGDVASVFAGDVVATDASPGTVARPATGAGADGPSVTDGETTDAAADDADAVAEAGTDAPADEGTAAEAGDDAASRGLFGRLLAALRNLF